MIPPDWINENLPPLQVMTQDFYTATLVSISKHAADAVRAQGELMPSTVKQIEAAQQAGLLYEDIERHVAAYLHIAIPEVRTLFKAAAVTNLAYENEILKEAGLPEIIYRQSPTMQRIVHAGATKAIGNLQRLTGVFTATAAEKMAGMLDTIYKRENVAYLQTVSGVESYVSAMNQAMDELVSDGIKIYSYASGKSISVEAAILRDLRTGIGQTAGEITRQGMVERGASYVQTTAHMGARNTGEGFKNHESWQGKGYYYAEVATEPNTHNFPDFVKTTGLGDVAGLLGANCRHNYAAYYPDFGTLLYSPAELEKYAEKTYIYTAPDGTEKTVDAYEASQILRKLERRARDIKTRLAVEQAKGDLSRPEVIITLKRDRAAANKRIDKFCTETGLKRQVFRERIARKG